MTEFKIYEHNSKNFKKNGSLSKRAEPVLARAWAMGDVDHAEEAKQIRSFFSGYISPIRQIISPYVFTHIEIYTAEKTYLLFQDVVLENGERLMTSPTKLFEALKQPEPVSV